MQEEGNKKKDQALQMVCGTHYMTCQPAPILYFYSWNAVPASMPAIINKIYVATGQSTYENGEMTSQRHQQIGKMTRVDPDPIIRHRPSPSRKDANSSVAMKKEGRMKHRPQRGTVNR